MPRAKPKIRVCNECGEPVEHIGNRPYTVAHGTIPGHMVPMLERLYGHVEASDGHAVTATRLVAAPRASCSCCGAVSKRALCADCRKEHGPGVSLYIASLRCRVKERREDVEARTRLAFDPADETVIQPYMGHSEECWTTTPMNLTEEIKARCPKCSTAPPPKPRRPRGEMTRAEELAASLDFSRAPRAPREP